MKVLPYKQLIAMSKEKLDEALAPIRERQAKAKAQLEVARIETELLTHEKKVQELCAEKDFNFATVLDALDKLALLERRQQQCGVVLEQLFPEEKA